MSITRKSTNGDKSATTQSLAQLQAEIQDLKLQGQRDQKKIQKQSLLLDQYKVAFEKD